jgi:5-formyltetrahydrofolate cyclo-ligase
MKDPIRAAARARLKALSAEQRARAGAAIARHVWELPEIAGSHRLLLYASLPSEVPTDAIAGEARHRGIEVVYPRCLPETRQMALHRLDAGDELRPGLYGIREPDLDCPLVRLEEIDAALVPGLAWDRAGGRMGRGAGYYDRLLGSTGWRGFICGLFFAAQEFDALPTSSLDVRLNAVVTEEEIMNFKC